MIPAGLLTEDGELNWNCPCLGGMATGPCGVEFRDAFTCFHYSDSDPKGSDCLESFRTMSSCMANYPGVYGSGDDNPMAVDDDDSDDLKNNNRSSNSSISTAEDTSSSEEKVVQSDAQSKEVSKS